MRTFWGVVLLIAMEQPGIAEGVDFSGDFGAGGGYADNLNHAGSDSLKEGSGFSSLWVMAGLRGGIRMGGRYYLSSRYDGTFYESFSDLTVNGLTIEAGLLYPVTDKVRVRISPAAGVRFYDDEDRDSRVYSVLLSARDQVFERLAVRAEYRYTNNDADLSVYSYGAHRLSAEVEAEVFSGGYLTFGYSAEFSQNNFYTLATTPVSGNMHGRRSSNLFGPGQEVYRTDTTAHTLLMGLDQELYKKIYLQLGYSFSSVQSDPGDYTEQFFSGGIGYRY